MTSPMGTNLGSQASAQSHNGIMPAAMCGRISRLNSEVRDRLLGGPEPKRLTAFSAMRSDAIGPERSCRGLSIRAATNAQCCDARLSWPGERLLTNPQPTAAHPTSACDHPWGTRTLPSDRVLVIARHRSNPAPRGLAPRTQTTVSSSCRGAPIADCCRGYRQCRQQAGR